MIQDTTATSTPAIQQTHNTSDPQEPEIPETTEKPPKYYPKTLEAIQLVNAGVSPEMALRFSNQKDNIRPETVSRFKQKLKKYTLTHPKLVKLAHNAVQDCLTDQPIISKRTDRQGNEIIEENTPTWANKIAAASMVYDRAEPVKQPEVHGGGLTVNVIPIAAQEIIERMMRWKNRQVEEVERKAVEEATSS
jgi:hypothetical protein